MLIDINRKIKKCLKNPLRHSRHVCQLTPALRGTYGPTKRVTANVTASRHCGAYVPSCISSIIKKTTPLLTGVRQTPTATRRGPNGGDIKTMATQAAAAKTSRAHAQKATALAVSSSVRLIDDDCHLGLHSLTKQRGDRTETHCRSSASSPQKSSATADGDESCRADVSSQPHA